MNSDDEEPRGDKPFEKSAKSNKIDNQLKQGEDSISVEDGEDPEQEKKPTGTENDSQIIGSTNAERAESTAKNSKMKPVLPFYLIGLISLSVAAFGFCFASFTEYAYTQYKFIVTRNFQWIWICAILAAIIFLVDLITLLILKSAKRVGSLKRLLFARFSIPFVASVIICIIVGLVGGKAYYNRIDADYKADNFYINEALQQQNGNSDSSTDNLSASLMPSHTASDAVVAVTLAATCTKYETKNQISNDDLAFFNNSENGGPAILVGGPTPLDPITNCIIQELHMPSSVETELKADIAQVVSVLQESQNSNPLTKLSGLPSINTSWNLQDGSTIYLSYGPPAIPLGSWSALIGVTKSILSGTSSSPSESSTNANGNSNSSSINSNATSSSTSTIPNAPNQTSSSLPTNSPNMNGSSGSDTDSSSPTDHSSDADAALNATKVCDNKGPNTYFNESDSGSPYVSTSGTKEWGQMMACVAQQSQMPSSVEIGLKNFLSNYVSALKNNSTFPAGGQMNWWLNDGSEITVSYGGAATTSKWVINFWTTNSPSANNNNNN